VWCGGGGGGGGGAPCVRAHHPGHVIEREVVLMKVDTSVELDQGSEHKFEVRQLRHHFWDFGTVSRAFLSPTLPTHAESYALHNARAARVLIGAWNPMLCLILGCRPSAENILDGDFIGVMGLVYNIMLKFLRFEDDDGEASGSAKVPPGPPPPFDRSLGWRLLSVYCSARCMVLGLSLAALPAAEG